MIGAASVVLEQTPLSSTDAIVANGDHAHGIADAPSAVTDAAAAVETDKEKGVDDAGDASLYDDCIDDDDDDDEGEDAVAVMSPVSLSVHSYTSTAPASPLLPVVSKGPTDAAAAAATRTTTTTSDRDTPVSFVSASDATDALPPRDHSPPSSPDDDDGDIDDEDLDGPRHGPDAPRRPPPASSSSAPTPVVVPVTLALCRPSSTTLKIVDIEDQADPPLPVMVDTTAVAEVTSATTSAAAAAEKAFSPSRKRQASVTLCSPNPSKTRSGTTLSRSTSAIPRPPAALSARKSRAGVANNGASGAGGGGGGGGDDRGNDPADEHDNKENIPPPASSIRRQVVLGGGGDSSPWRRVGSQR